MKYAYKGIRFAKDYNKSFADFKNEFGSTHIFKEIPHLERDKELRKVYDGLIKHNGKLSDSTKKSKGNKASKGKK